MKTILDQQKENWPEKNTNISFQQRTKRSLQTYSSILGTDSSRATKGPDEAGVPLDTIPIDASRSFFSLASASVSLCRDRSHVKMMNLNRNQVNAHLLDK
jgi:hypothetical protein